MLWCLQWEMFENSARVPRPALRGDADGANHVGQDGAPDTRVVLPVGQRGDGGGDGGAPLLPENNYNGGGGWTVVRDDAGTLGGGGVVGHSSTTLIFKYF